MRMLELRTIDLNHCPWVAKQNLCGRFHDACLAGTCWAEKEQVPNGPPRRIQSSTEYLIQVDQRLHAFFLPYDLRAQRILKLHRLRAASFRIEGKFRGAH